MAKTYTDNRGTMGKPTGIETYDVMVFGEQAHKIHKVVVHRFRMGDVEDPDLYAAQPLWEWQQSDMGKWVMSKAVDTPEWHRAPCGHTLTVDYAITAKLKDIDYTFWTLKWSDQVDRQGTYTV